MPSLVLLTTDASTPEGSMTMVVIPEVASRCGLWARNGTVSRSRINLESISNVPAIGTEILQVCMTTVVTPGVPVLVVGVGRSIPSHGGKITGLQPKT